MECYYRLAQKLAEKFIWMPSSVTLQTMIGDSIKIYGKIKLNIGFWDTTYYCVAYVVSKLIHESNFKLHFENNEFQ